MKLGQSVTYIFLQSSFASISMSKVGELSGLPPCDTVRLFGQDQEPDVVQITIGDGEPQDVDPSNISYDPDTKVSNVFLYNHSLYPRLQCNM